MAEFVGSTNTYKWAYALAVYTNMHTEVMIIKYGFHRTRRFVISLYLYTWEISFCAKPRVTRQRVDVTQISLIRVNFSFIAQPCERLSSMNEIFAKTWIKSEFGGHHSKPTLQGKSLSFPLQSVHFRPIHFRTWVCRRLLNWDMDET